MEFLAAPVAPSTKKKGNNASSSNNTRLIVVLCQSSLETVKVGSGKEGRYALLNCDDHAGILLRNKKDPSHYRPDITHQVSR